MRYRLTDGLMRWLQRIAAIPIPKESCGVALGCATADGLIEFFTAEWYPNLAKDPCRTFEMDGTRFRAACYEAEQSNLLLALWHSHPTTKPEPSKEDFDLIRQLDSIPCIIVGVQQQIVTVYECEQGRVREDGRFHYVTEE